LLEEQTCFENNCVFDLTVKCLDVNKILSLLLHHAFWRCTEYYTTTNAQIIYYTL